GSDTGRGSCCATGVALAEVGQHGSRKPASGSDRTDALDTGPLCPPQLPSRVAFARHRRRPGSDSVARSRGYGIRTGVRLAADLWALRDHRAVADLRPAGSE